jgi:hypothetical protein
MSKGKTKAVGNTSKGERPNVSRRTKLAVRRARSPLDVALAKMAAHRRGKRTVWTVDNPIGGVSNQRMVRVLGKVWLGKPKKATDSKPQENE